MSITVIDVAREAGVSRTTVSNVFNGKAKYSEETRQAVLDAARRLGYKPNLAAKSLITNRSNLIGLVLPSYVDQNTLTNSPFYNIIMDGIYSVLQKEPYYDLIISPVMHPSRLSQVSDWITQRNVDGLLAVGEYDLHFLQDLNSRAMPVVLIDNYQKNFANFSYINTDDEAGGQVAARCLIERGCQKIAVCSVSYQSSPLMQKRCRGFSQALAEAGRPETLLKGDGSPYEAGRSLGERLIKGGFDGIFCTEDMLAIGVLHALLETHVRVGVDVALVGFDNLQIGQQIYPELTTINQNIYEKGEVAARTLLDILKNDAMRNTRLTMPVQLVRRQTA